MRLEGEEEGKSEIRGGGRGGRVRLEGEEEGEE